MWRSLIAGLALVGGGLLHAAEWPVFANDAEADGWLRSHSPFYAQMAGEIDGRGGLRYTANPGHPRAGDIHFENGQRCLALGEELRGVERVSVLIFEMTNAYQEERHHEIDARARTGAVVDPIQFGLLHELIEYDGLRYHRRVLAELEPALDGVPREAFAWVDPTPVTFAKYELPLASAYVEAQAKSGHTAHYERWFWIQAGRAALPD